MPNLGMPELIMIFVIALVVFGPKQLPEIGRMIGKASSLFRKANQDLRDSMKMDMNWDDEYPRRPRKIIPSEPVEPIKPKMDSDETLPPEEKQDTSS